MNLKRFLIITAGMVVISSCHKDFRQDPQSGLTPQQVMALKADYPRVVFNMDALKTSTMEEVVKATNDVMARKLPTTRGESHVVSSDAGSKYTPAADQTMGTGWYDIGGIDTDEYGQYFRISLHYEANSGGSGSISSVNMSLYGVSIARTWKQDHVEYDGMGSDGYWSFAVDGYYGYNYMFGTYTSHVQYYVNVNPKTGQSYGQWQSVP